MTAPFSLTGRTALITGATRGIGRALAENLLARDGTVLAVARDAAALDAFAAADPGRVHPFRADLAAPGAARAIADWVIEDHPRCSLLINNAAIMVHTRLTDDPARHEAEIAREIAINLTAPVHLATLLLPVLAAQPEARVVNVASALAVAPLANASVYCATKAGLRSFSKSLRYQCEDAGLPVGVLDAVMTLTATQLSEGDGDKRMPPEAAAAAVLTALQEGRPEVWVGNAKLLHAVWRLSPTLAERIMRARTP